MGLKFTRRDFLMVATASAIAACTRPQPPSVSTSDNIESANPAKTEGLRVVALEWVYVENLLALGIQPVGVADIAGYKKYVKIPPQLAETVQDVGTRQEPSLEAIAQLEPNLILGVEMRHQAIESALSAIAPTQLFNPYPDPKNGNQLTEMQQTFRQIAKTCQKSAEAEQVLGKMQSQFQQAAEKIKAANLIGNSVLLGQFVPELRLMTQNSIASQILETLGLKNAWNGTLDRFGFNTVGIESLIPLQTVYFLYTAENNQIPPNLFANNPVWQNLNFVQQKRLHSLGEDTWIFGGPLSAQILVEKVAQALTRNA